MKFQKILFTTSLLGVLAITTSCAPKEEKEVVPEIPYTKDDYPFTTIYTNKGSYTFSVFNENFPESCRKVEYLINKSIGTNKYIKLELETDCNLVGWIKYADENNPSKTNEEKIFIEKGSTKFTTFLDFSRDGAYGNFEKTKIISISFRSVDSTKMGKMTFKSLSYSNRTINKDRMFIDDGTIKIGTSIKFGGSIEWLERIDINVIEYLDSGRNVRIDRDIDPGTIEPNKLIATEVNMVNIYDYGREIQPSYYLSVNKEDNGYDPKTKYNYEAIGGTFKYNPIQCGGVGDRDSTDLKEKLVGAQIVDYEYKKDHIYIKTKAQDWMFVNDQSQGYYEVTYKFGQDGVLLVETIYTDFYGFTNLNPLANPSAGQECPATYFVYPLNYFYMKTKTRTINDPFLGPQGKSGVNPILDPMATTPEAGKYFYAINSSYCKNSCDWVAFVNDQKFGAGIYMPNCDRFIASRGWTSNRYSEVFNQNYFTHLYDFGDKMCPSYAAPNYNYINPQLIRRMVEYVPLKYSYALFIGDTDEMDDAFANTKLDGLTNDELTMTENTWPRV